MRVNYDVIKNVKCFHKSTTDFLTGENAIYHKHEDEYEIYMYIKGNTKFYVEEKCFIMTPGNIIIVKPGALHRSIITDHLPYERIGINITGSCLHNLSSEHTSLSACFEFPHNVRIINLPPHNMELFIQYVDEYLSHSGSDKYGKDILCFNVLTKLLIYINTLFMENPDTKQKNIMPEIVSNTIRYIDENIGHELSLSNISNNLNYSSNYIGLIFKEHTGMTVHHYILDKRIELAKKFLKDGKNVSDACELSGFNDYANFIRTFKKMTGISPGKYLSRE